MTIDERIAMLEAVITANAGKLDAFTQSQSESKAKPESKKEPEKSDVSMDEIKKIVNNFDL